MAATIKIKNSSTTGAVPTSGDLVQGELAINVTDLGLYTENASGTVVKLNAPSIDDKGTGATKRLTIDTSGNLGLGVVPSAWWSSFKALQFGTTGSVYSGVGATGFGHNMYYDGTNSKYLTNNYASLFQQLNGTYVWNTAPSGTAGNNITFTQAMTLDASGRLGIGTTSPSQPLSVNGSDGSNNIASFTRSSGATLYAYGDTGANVGFFTGSNAAGSGFYANATNNTVQFNTNGSERARITAAGNLDMSGGGVIGRSGNSSGIYFGSSCVLPASDTALSDNGKSFGNASWRWTTIYAVTGTINTSDAREKTEVSALNDAEITAAKQIASEVGSYKWLSAIEQKGESARKHIGLTVQRAIEIMESNGLVPFGYGFICLDTWEDEIAEDGTVIKEAGSRYGFRMDELSMFIAKGQQQAIQEQQTLIATQSGLIQQLQADVRALKGQ